MPSTSMPQVWGRVSSSAKRTKAWPQDSLSVLGACGRRGSCTMAKISSQDATHSPHSSQKPLRQPPSSTTQASGVPVNSRPRPPTPMDRPEKKANRSAGKWRAMKMVQARKAGEQPTPISNWPSISQP